MVDILKEPNTHIDDKISDKPSLKTKNSKIDNEQFVDHKNCKKAILRCWNLLDKQKSINKYLFI